MGGRWSLSGGARSIRIVGAAISPRIVASIQLGHKDEFGRTRHQVGIQASIALVEFRAVAGVGKQGPHAGAVGEALLVDGQP